VSNEIVEIMEEQLQEISGGMIQCKKDQVPTNIYDKSTGTWSTGCDG